MHLGPHCHDAHGRANDHLRLNRSFAIAVVLNVLLVIGEAVGGWWSGSLALLADAGHNLSDVAGLALAWWAHWLRRRGTSERWTYGWRGFTILAANLNGLLLIVAIVGVSIESVRRLLDPQPIEGLPIMAVALVAAILNFFSARLLAFDGHDLNVRGAYLHMLADAAVSLAVVVGGLLMWATGWYWVDPAISLAICAVLTLGTWGLLRESVLLLLHAAPRNVDVAEVRQFLGSLVPVTQVLDLHVWSVSTTDVLLTARLQCSDLAAEAQDELLVDIHDGLEQEFGISHATVEISRGFQVSDRCVLDAKPD